MGSLFSEEKYIKEEVDKDYEKKLRLYALKRSGAQEKVIIEAENEIVDGIEKRNRSALELTRKIINESKKYYNEIGIK